MFSFSKLKGSFRNAFRGIKRASGEQTFRILLVCAVAVTPLIVYFPLTNRERALLVLTITAVLALELINSQIERILNILRPDYCEEVRLIKDVSAGAVLITGIGAAIIGLIIFLPHLS